MQKRITKWWSKNIFISNEILLLEQKFNLIFC